ncbi:MAG: DUF2797 domain-containing protein [Pseudomonadales bacterium]|nr:DUF2797 domain-containing protein [Pseudomonadales bacterium]NRA14449.1 DUF2797 domain-containing protein [Oceanospirillaceae bacterium]
MPILRTGTMQKMRTELSDSIKYYLELDDQPLLMNELIGQEIYLENLGEIHCSHCGRLTKKSFSQGYCFPCFKKLPQCDLCMMSPDRCHFHLGTCRDEEWGKTVCFNEHIVYLANSSGVKVGITRATQVPTRWIDQGAVEALPIFRVKTRQQSGLVEKIFSEHISDKTNWRKMLKGEITAIDLPAMRDQLMETCKSELAQLTAEHGLQSIVPITGVQVQSLSYPVIEYPSKISSHNLDKTPKISGVLQGIKGQYLMLDTGVINLRKYTSYAIEIGTCA